MHARIDYLELPSADGEASVAFFEAAFGWARIDYGPDYAGLGGAGLETGIDSSVGRVAAPLPVIRVGDLDAAEVSIRNAGGVVTREQFDFPGGRRFHFREPGGVELAVYRDASA
ncbi:VOC family protein [Arsenicitalea aurantiaca]|uniref:VOC family protein n=1 Tax=Arsenicitalea aurantiaca TaxID=1783274 RepID=A0A433X5Y8_9HYPH|nr:VOC family protein [Arsenicitalea aurantiaca]RUT29469.1 VOC family protein [Arsenicitalea aurantiaca]